MSLFFFSNFVAHVSSARRSCISGYCEFHRGVRLQRNAEQARKHRQADSLIRTRQLHVCFLHQSGHVEFILPCRTLFGSHRFGHVPSVWKRILVRF